MQWSTLQGDDMRIGLVGTGYWATAIHGPGAAGHPQMEFVGVWGRDAAKTAQAAHGLGVRAYSDFDALLDDVDAANAGGLAEVGEAVQSGAVTVLRPQGQFLHVGHGIEETLSRRR